MKTVLLVIDMQNSFEGMVSSCLPNVCTLIHHFRALNLPVIFTQHGHSDDELTPPYINQLVRKWGVEGSIRFGSHSWKLLPEMVPLVEQSPVVAKNTYDAFLDTDLEDVLRQEGLVERIVACGVMTDCCCDTTARAAFNRGYETWLVGDACGSTNEQHHKAGLKAFEFAFGPVMTTGEVLDKIPE